MSRVVSLRISDEQAAQLERLKRRLHQRSIGGVIQLFLEEKLREERHPYIFFRDWGGGRRARLEGTGLTVWELKSISRLYNDDVAETSNHLDIAPELVRAALAYAADYHEEIDAELAEYDAIDFDSLKRILPNIERISVPIDDEILSDVAQAT